MSLHGAFSRKHKKGSLSQGVRIIAWARTAHWIGWGFGESLIPLFLFHFSQTFAEAGLFRSLIDITGLLCLPLVGEWADRSSAKKIILFSLLLYPLVGFGYLLAGMTGMAIFVVFARVVNGIGWSMNNIGVDTYYRRSTDSTDVNSSFGYMDMVANFGWIGSALIGMALVKFVPIYYLLGGIIPFALLAFFIALKAPDDVVPPVAESGKASVLASYRMAIQEWISWNGDLRLLGTLMFFSSLIGTLISFFIPIDAYIDGAQPAMVILLGIVGTIPSLFGYALGKVADHHNKYQLIALGLVTIVGVTIGLVLFPDYGFKLLASFILGIVLEWFAIIQKGLVTSFSSPATYGERGSAFEGIINLGDLTAPLLLGILLDIMGFSTTALIVAGVGTILLGLFWRAGVKRQ